MEIFAVRYFYTAQLGDQKIIDVIAAPILLAATTIKGATTGVGGPRERKEQQPQVQRF